MAWGGGGGRHRGRCALQGRVREPGIPREPEEGRGTAERTARPVQSQPASQPASELESLPFHLCSAGVQVHATKLCFCYMGASEPLRSSSLHLTEPYPKPHTHLLTLYLLVFQLPNPVPHQQESSTNWSALKVLFGLKYIRYICETCIFEYLSIKKYT